MPCTGFAATAAAAVITASAAAGDTAKMARSMLTLLLVAACAASAMAYPSFWPGRAPNCLAVPTEGIACHKTPQVDT
jgi:hypothetical protein